MRAPRRAATPDAKRLQVDDRGSLRSGAAREEAEARVAARVTGDPDDHRVELRLEAAQRAG